MGECHCSNIAIMQLFHELKQQFPALPDHVVSQCIAQNSHDRETCARSLRATQESRPSPGAFPPPAPSDNHHQHPYHQRHLHHPMQQHQQRCCSSSNQTRGCCPIGQSPIRANRPASLDIGPPGRSSIGCPRACAQSATVNSAIACPAGHRFFDDVEDVHEVDPPLPVDPTNAASGFELNVNVACSPAGNREFRTTGNGIKRSDLVIEPRPHYANPQLSIGRAGAQIDQTRSYTSVSLTLRPPSSEPQPPIDIRSEGSSLTYSTSSLDPRGFQSRLQISIGQGSVGSVAAARIRPPMGPVRPTSLVSPIQIGPQRPPGLPAGPPSQLPRPTTTMSAPSTPSGPAVSSNVATASSLPATPSGPKAMSPPSSPVNDRKIEDCLISNDLAEHQKKLVAEQLARKEKLARELRAEKGRLEAMKKELQSLVKPFDSTIPPQELKRKLKSEIYQLQLECDRLADQVDQWSDPRVPLGETNEEFYQGIYTGQSFLPVNSSSEPPPLPNRPPAWQPEHLRNDADERDGPSWVCRMCTFDNHPLMSKCEQCDMPRIDDHGNSGETQDIHIRVTHHHNFSPRRTVHSWAV